MLYEVITNVSLRELVVGQVNRLVTKLAHLHRKMMSLLFSVDGNSDEDVSGIPASESIIELGDTALADNLLTEGPQGAWLFGNRHRKERLALFTDQSALPDISQALKVHVGTGGDRNQPLVLQST